MRVVVDAVSLHTHTTVNYLNSMLGVKEQLLRAVRSVGGSLLTLHGAKERPLLSRSEHVLYLINLKNLTNLMNSVVCVVMDAVSLHTTVNYWNLTLGAKE